MKKKVFDPMTIAVIILSAAILLITIIAAVITSADNNGNQKVTTKPPELSFPDVSDVPVREDIMVTYSELTSEDTYEKNGIEYIYSFISYPHIEGGNTDATAKINNAIAQFAFDRVMIEDYEKTNAEEAYNRAESDAMGFIEFEFLTRTESVYVKNGYLSIMFKRVRTVSISEPSETVTTLCFDLLNGDEVDISVFMNVESGVAEQFVYDVFAQHIKINPNQYYNDALETLSDIIDLNAFYLTENGVVLYFNPEIITPSVMGIRNFTVPYEKIGY